MTATATLEAGDSGRRLLGPDAEARLFLRLRATIAWATLRPGDRVIVWLAAAGHRCLVLDVVDPATGEALAYEVAAVAEDGRPLTAVAPPSRVVVGRPAGCTTPGIVKGGMMHIAPAGIATAGETGRQLGPVEALALAR